MCFSFSRIQAARCSVFAPKWTPIAGSLTSPAQNVPPSHTSPAQHPHIPPQKMHSSGLANPTLTEIHVALKRVLFLHDVQHTWPGSPPPRPFPALRLAIEIFQVCSALLVSSRARTKNKASSSCRWKENRQDWVQRPDDMRAEWFYLITVFLWRPWPSQLTRIYPILEDKKEPIELFASVHRVYMNFSHSQMKNYTGYLKSAVV